MALESGERTSREYSEPLSTAGAVELVNLKADARAHPDQLIRGVVLNPAGPDAVLLVPAGLSAFLNANKNESAGSQRVADFGEYRLHLITITRDVQENSATYDSRKRLRTEWKAPNVGHQGGDIRCPTPQERKE